MKLILQCEDGTVVKTWEHPERDFRRRVTRELIMMEIAEAMIKLEVIDALHDNIVKGTE